MVDARRASRPTGWNGHTETTGQCNCAEKNDETNIHGNREWRTNGVVATVSDWAVRFLPFVRGLVPKRNQVTGGVETPNGLSTPDPKGRDPLPAATSPLPLLTKEGNTGRNLPLLLPTRFREEPRKKFLFFLITQRRGNQHVLIDTLKIYILGCSGINQSAWGFASDKPLGILSSQ